MAVDHQFETETMARIYTEQGHYAKAAAIYRQLLREAPEREDLRQRLEAVEGLAQGSGTAQLSDQFSEWLQLLLKKKQIDRLRRFRKSRS
jgi:hypothetical protein